MGILLYIFILVLAILLAYYIAKQFESVAADKGYADTKYFHLCFWLGLPGWLLVIALPDRNNGTTKSSNQPYTINDKLSDNHTEDTLPTTEEPFVWHPVDEANALVVGETNIKCTNCRHIQFKGYKFCNQCGAKLLKIEQ